MRNGNVREVNLGSGRSVPSRVHDASPAEAVARAHSSLTRPTDRRETELLGAWACSRFDFNLGQIVKEVKENG